MGIIIVKSMAFQALAMFSTGSRFVFGSLHFIVNQLGDLIMQEPEQQENSGSGINQSSTTLARVSLVSEAWLGHESDVLREFESDLFKEDVGHLGSCHPNMEDSIYNVIALSESDSEGDREVFMMGKGGAPADQTKEEIDQATPSRKSQGLRG
jgi:hypothetical protein